MNPFHEACRAWFAFTLIVALIWISIFTHTVTLISSLGLISELRSQDTCVAIAVVAFRTLLLCNPQIKIKRGSTRARTVGNPCGLANSLPTHDSLRSPCGLADSMPTHDSRTCDRGHHELG